MNTDIRLYRLIGLFGICISMTISTCTCRINCTEMVYSFDIHVQAYPDKDSIRLGDTVWIEVNAPTRLMESRSGVTVPYENALNLGTAITFIKIKPGSVSHPGGGPSAKSFDYHLVRGDFVPQNPRTDKIKEFLFIQDKDQYRFKAGFIPKEKGAFIISPGNAANVYRKNDKCTKAGFSITFENTDQHLYLYEQSRPGYVPSEYEKTHQYCFKVY